MMLMPPLMPRCRRRHAAIVSLTPIAAAASAQRKGRCYFFARCRYCYYFISVSVFDAFRHALMRSAARRSERNARARQQAVPRACRARYAAAR
jgi:hypothetical protein